MKPQLTTTLAEFSRLAKRGNVVPVFAEFVADGETPVSAVKKLDRGGYSFLFESTEKNDVSGRFSFVGTEPRVVVQSYGHEVRIAERGREERFNIAADPLDELRKLMARYQFVSRPELPRFARRENSASVVVSRGFINLPGWKGNLREFFCRLA